MADEVVKYIAFVGLVGGLLFFAYVMGHSDGKCSGVNLTAEQYNLAVQCK